jgi:hypothetical protein
MTDWTERGGAFAPPLLLDNKYRSSICVANITNICQYGVTLSSLKAAVISSKGIEVLSSDGRFSGKAKFDLYSSDSGWFKDGQTFLVEVEFANGARTSKTVRLGAR